MTHQQHLDRLSSIDASFLHQEGHASHMHIGGVLVFEGPPPSFADLCDHVRGRLHLVPRYRQKLVTPPLQAGRPLWIDDPDFNIEYHLRHTALPAPGSEEQLTSLAARIASQRLDRAKPLWEMWLVEGLEDGRFALISKTHHALVDGISGVDLASVLFDLQREPAALDEGLMPWRPQPEPSPGELVLAGVRGALRTTLELTARGLAAAARPGSSLELTRDVAEGLGELVWAGLNPAPETPLNVPIGPYRRYAIIRQRLDSYREVKHALGGTVNDVVLTVVTGALARWLRSRGMRTEGLEMRALVPVSVRTGAQRGSLGNRLTVMRAPLPLYIDDAAARLRFIAAAMADLKESKQAVGAATLAAVNSLAPPTILAQASRLNFSTRLFNLIVTNVPGPQLPLYVLGRQLCDLFPVAFLPENHALAVAIMSYNGGLNYGLLGDYDAIPDIGVVADGLDQELHDLVRAAGGRRTSATANRRAKPSATGRAKAPATGRAKASDTGRAKATTAAGRAKAPSTGRAKATTAAGRAKATTATGRTKAPTTRRAKATPQNGAAPILPTGNRRPSRGPAADMRAKRTRRPRPIPGGGS